MPFRVAWTDAIGSPGFVESFVAYHRQQRGEWRPESWNLLLCVFADDEPIGSQGLCAHDFALTRTAQTGSWLGRRFQGRGYGTEMRAAVLELAFAGLGAGAATSGAVAGNLASLRVSEKLGYEPAGEGVVTPRGEPVRELHLRLTRERWQAGERPPVEIAALEPCLPLFGL